LSYSFIHSAAETMLHRPFAQFRYQNLLTSPVLLLIMPQFLFAATGVRFVRRPKDEGWNEHVPDGVPNIAAIFAPRRIGSNIGGSSKTAEAVSALFSASGRQASRLQSRVGQRF
jgi:hypothetical protein